MPVRVFVLMDDMEETLLTPEAEAEATDRDDDLGRLFTVAFTIDVPPFPFWQDGHSGGEA